MVKLKTVTTDGIHRGTCEEFLEWEIKAASHDRKGKYEVTPNSAVFKRLEPEYRQPTLICLISQAFNHAGCQPLNLSYVINVLFQVRCSRLNGILKVTTNKSTIKRAEYVRGEVDERSLD